MSATVRPEDQEAPAGERTSRRTGEPVARGREAAAVASRVPGRDARATVTREPTVLGAITLAGVERSVAHARRFARDVLGCHHPALDEVELAVSELTTNAIKHSPSGDGGEIAIGVAATGPVVRVEVTNDGGAMPVAPGARADADAEDGRGILIVEALADAWGVVRRAGTTTVWAELHADGRS